MFITCGAATELRTFDRFLLVIRKNGRTCWASVTLLLPEQNSNKPSEHARVLKLSEHFYLFIVQW